MKLFILKQDVIESILNDNKVKLAVMIELNITDSRSIKYRINKDSQELTQINVLTALSNKLDLPIHDLYQEK